MQNEKRRLHLRDVENRRVVEVGLRRVREFFSDTALRLLVLELPRQPGAPADAGVGARHIADGRSRFRTAKPIRLRDHVGDLVAAPRVALNADGLLVDEAQLHDGSDRGQHAAQRTLARLAGLVDDVGREDDVAVARVKRNVDARARCGVDETVHALREPFVDVDDHRVFFLRIEIRRLVERGLEWHPVGAAERNQFAAAPGKLCELGSAVRRLGECGERRVGHLHIGKFVEA